jgi:hypothetical protein
VVSVAGLPGTCVVGANVGANVGASLGGNVGVELGSCWA